MKSKKIICAILGAAMLMSTTESLAAFPPIKYAENEKVDISIANKSEIGTISARNAAFQIDFSPKTADDAEYIVKYSIDGVEKDSTVVNVPPAKTTQKSFEINTTNGIHDIEVNVLRGGNVVKSFKDKIYVMDLYEHQFMDELSGRGVNVHFSWDSWKHNGDLNLNFMKYGGYRVVRSASPSWSSGEKSKGKYDFSVMNTYLGWLDKINAKSYDMVTYGNGLIYPPERGMDGTEPWPEWEKTQPQTHDSIWGYAKYTNALAEKVEDPIGFELWNEPNHYTEDTPVKAQKYCDYVKPTRVYLNYNGHDTIDLAPFSLAYNDEINFVDYCFKYGLYPYFNSIAHHPYVWEGGFTSTRLQEYRMDQIEDLILKYGGWKDREITEIGYPTTTASNTPTEESASIDIVKTFIVSEAKDNEVTIFYDMVNDGEDESYTEHNFGQVKYDGTPKKPYMTTTAFNIKTEGGIYVGEIETGIDMATRAFLYYKDGKPIVVAWSNQMDNSSVRFELPGEKAVIYDVYGNEIARDMDYVMLEESPVYIENLGMDWCARAVHDEVAARNSKWLTAYKDSLSQNVQNEVKSCMTAAEKAFVGTPSAEEVLKQLDNYKNAGLLIADEAQNGVLEEVEASRMLYELFRIMQRVDNLYVTAYNGEVPSITTRTDETYEKAKVLYKNDMRIKQYSDEMLRHAMRYIKNARKVSEMEENPSKAGIISGWNVIADALCDWFDKFSSFESVLEMGYTIQTPYYDRVSYINTDVTMEVSLDNYSHNDFNGTIKIFDDAGEVVAQSEQLTVPAEGGYKTIYMTVNTKRPTDGTGFGHYFISYVDNDGNVVYTQPTDIKVKDKFKAEVLPSTASTDKLDKVSLKIENLTDSKAVAHLKITSDENFSFSTNNLDVSLEASGSAVVDVPIASIKNTKYHFYSFSYEVTDDDGNIVASSDEVMSFTTVVKAENPIDVASFDGDISDWEDAYPIYINAPKNVTQKESWDGAECSTRAFMKWDENNLYILADVYDEAYLQEFAGVNMWQGDCIQLSLDPKNDGKSKDGYGVDDYELGFSYTSNGNEFYSWYSPNSLTGGVVDWFKIIRNNDLHISRYLIKLDKSIITTLDLKEGNVLGMNMAINDADILGRENFYQFTLGTADSKNPDLYADFTLSSVKEENIVDGMAGKIFPTKLEASEIVFENGFEDVKGHWAEEAITAMAKKGYVSGMDETHFAPDKTVTRAEFFEMLTNVAGYKKADYNGSFTDVSASDWFAPAVQALSNSNMIPGNLVNDGALSPNENITREDAAYLAMNLGYVEKMSKIYWYKWGDPVPCSNYPDGDQVSEWVKPILEIALANKVLVGDENGYLNPKQTLTRAEAVALLQRIMVYLV